MALSVTRAVSAGLYVPFRGVDREVSAVGTLSIDATATGDATGAPLTIVLSMGQIEFGFHAIWIPTRVVVLENNGAAQEVLFVYQTAGNQRIQGGLSEEITTRVTVDGDNVGNAEFLAVPIEPDSLAQANVFSARWAVNNDANIYELHMFGVLYDAEAIARGKRPGAVIDTFMAGVR